MRALLQKTVIVVLLLCLAGWVQADQETRSLCDISYPSDTGIEWTCRKLTWKDTPQGVFGEMWQEGLRFNRLDRRHFVGGLSIKVPTRMEQLKHFSPLPASIPEAGQDERFILVDLAEMFLGAYEYGRLVAAYPVAVGIGDNPVPVGEFRIDAVDRRHSSNQYAIEELGRPYPMHYGLRFFVDKSQEGWPSYWIHGRDLPGHPASHGCIGLYDEEMQREYYSRYDRKVNKTHYRELKRPYLKGARELYQWVVGEHEDSGRFHRIKYGPRVLIRGTAPTQPPAGK